MVKEAVAQLRAVSHTAETYRAEMNRLASQLPEYETVMAMTGVGKSMGPQLIAEIGDLRLRAACLDLLGDCHLALGRAAEAASHYQQAIEVADAAGFAQVQTQARIHLARMHLAAGDVLAAAKVSGGAARHGARSATATTCSQPFSMTTATSRFGRAPSLRRRWAGCARACSWPIF